MGRARAGCNDGEVTRDADERWRERQREQREMSRIFHVESAGEQADRETKRLAEVCVCVCFQVCARLREVRHFVFLQREKNLQSNNCRSVH